MTAFLDPCAGVTWQIMDDEGDGSDWDDDIFLIQRMYACNAANQPKAVQWTDPPPRGKTRSTEYLHWQQSPLGASSTGPFPSQATSLAPVGKVNAKLTTVYAGWLQQPLSPSAIGEFTSKVVELPPRGKVSLARYQDWQQSPLAASSSGPFPSQFTVLPIGKKRPLLLDWSQQPLSPDSIGPFSQHTLLPVVRKATLLPKWEQSPLAADNNRETIGSVSEVPIRGRRAFIQDWLQAPLSPDSTGPFTQSFALPVRGRAPLHQRWEQLPLSVDSTGPFSQAFELPVRGRAPLLRTWEQQPLSSDSAGPFSQVDLLPPIGKVVKREYNGWQIAPLSPDGIIADTALKGIFWFDNPQRGRSQAHLYTGATSAPLASSLVGTIQQFLPLLGVGS